MMTMCLKCSPFFLDINFSRYDIKLIVPIRINGAFPSAGKVIRGQACD